MLQGNGTVQRYQHFKDHLQINTHFLQYCAIVTAIPWKFRSAKLDRQEVYDINNFNFENLKNSGSQVAYSKLLGKVTFTCKWSTTFDTDFKDVFNVCYACTVDTKLRNFQYKLINKILPTKNLLLKMRVKDNNLCNFCKLCKDSLEHIYYGCEIVQAFWLTVDELICNLVLRDVDGRPPRLIDKQIVILGYRGIEVWSKTINFLILFCKHYIHCCYWTNQQPAIDLMLQKLKNYQYIELEIAVHQDKIDYHIEKYKLLNVLY